MSEFLKLDNRVIIKLKIVPVSPLLILDSRAMAKLEAGEMNKCLFLRDNKKQLYIPGSTLKGLFREKFYQIYGDKEKIAEIFGREEKDGVKGTKSKMFFEDARPVNKKVEEIVKIRNITPINHFSAEVKVPLEFEYTKEPFLSEIIVNNATVSDIQNIYFVIRDSMNGEIRIGSSKTRGFGEIHFEVEELILEKYHDKEILTKKEFFTRNEKLSQKVGDKYLKEVLYLNPKYKKIDTENPNEFITTLFSEVK